MKIKTNYISDFDYDTEYQKTQDITVLKELYQNSGSIMKNCKYIVSCLMKIVPTV